MTPRLLLHQTAAQFRLLGIPDPEEDSALLLSSLCGRPPLSLRLDSDTELSPEMIVSFHILAGRRIAREPLQYILQEAPFCGRLFYVDPRVLIPRPETELLCEWGHEIISSDGSAEALDLCCGSGCIGITLALNFPSVHFTLSDISQDALEVAQLNASRLGADVVFHQGDLTEGLPDDSFDAVFANPPYIPTEDCAHLQPEVMKEPVIALNGGEDGLDFYRRIVLKSCRVLKPGGFLLMEVGFSEADKVACLLNKAGFTGLMTRKDYNGIDRMIMARSAPREDLCLKN